jgi:hypothetical protein
MNLFLVEAKAPLDIEVLLRAAAILAPEYMTNNIADRTMASEIERE